MNIHEEQWYRNIRRCCRTDTQRRVCELYFVHFRRCVNPANMYRYLALEMHPYDMPSYSTICRVLRKLDELYSAQLKTG